MSCGGNEICFESKLINTRAYLSTQKMFTLHPGGKLPFKEAKMLLKTSNNREVYSKIAKIAKPAFINGTNFY